MTRRIFRTIALVALAGGVTACGRGVDEDGKEIPTPVFGAEEARGSVDLHPLSPEVLGAADLGGDLGCSFTDSAIDDPLLVVRAKVDAPSNRPRFAALLSGTLITGEADRAGGYASIRDGGRFSANGVLLEVATTGDGSPDDPVGFGCRRHARFAPRRQQAGVPGFLDLRCLSESGNATPA